MGPARKEEPKKKLRHTIAAGVVPQHITIMLTREGTAGGIKKISTQKEKQKRNSHRGGQHRPEGVALACGHQMRKNEKEKIVTYHHVVVLLHCATVAMHRHGHTGGGGREWVEGIALH